MRIWPTEFNPVTKLDNSLLNTQFFTEMDWFLDRNYTMYKKVQKDYLLRLPRTKLKIIYSNYRCRTVFLLLIIKMPPISSQFFYNIVAHWLLCSSKLFKKKYNEKKMKFGQNRPRLSISAPTIWTQTAPAGVTLKTTSRVQSIEYQSSVYFLKTFLEERIQISEPARSGNSKRLQVGNNAYRPTSKKRTCGGAWLNGFWYRNQRTNALVYWRFFRTKLLRASRSSMLTSWNRPHYPFRCCDSPRSLPVLLCIINVEDAAAKEGSCQLQPDENSVSATAFTPALETNLRNEE